ncbi:alternate F1F0 ATPase, F1 subunit alpha [Chryseobacterium gotjawalense]|uniref:ATP synthase subunit alpha n=1 Tax=Chryseobacterium gotjawalense TaxID=3042315 RepID=A0ABY8RG07_9FLAO|nr:alternate F1F0 ATPase, F1 subunit alpha [Chryseobacterium sp. wdc7]WHF52905.1 alternate F1F0 ATPase, F1 subunit alpha [Chryseobacterium sp. wdc7]
MEFVRISHRTAKTYFFRSKRKEHATARKKITMSALEINPTQIDPFKQIDKGIENFSFSLQLREIGMVTSVATGIAIVSGLPNVGFEELLQFQNGLFGIAYNLDEEEIGVILLGKDSCFKAGDEVERTGRVMDIPVGNSLIGRVIDPLGQPLDNKERIQYDKRLPIERPAPGIMDRSAVSVPLQTGIKVIDALIPIGRGQRELIVGDRGTGKTAIAIDAILNQYDKNVVCIYCAIGQRASAVATVIARLEEKGAMEYSIVVVAEGNDSPGIEYIAPYAATSIAEYFMEEGRDVLIVYDDLIHHARAYRELSLLLRRPPGREAFPGDIFYIHSRLLERATHLSDPLKGGSITALPIIETEAQNISAYIPTNLISITDGQIYLSPKLFELGLLPAVDVGKSVSRVGDKAQLDAYAAISKLKLEYSQFEELETFARFGTRLDDNTRKTIEHGKRIRECLKQEQFQQLTAFEQIFILLPLKEGFLDTVPIEKIKDAEDALLKSSAMIPDEIQERILSNKKLDDNDTKTILKIAQTILVPFQEKPKTDADQNKK